MTTAMTQYHIVWNADRSEGFITNDENDAIAAAGNRRVNGESALGADFRDHYDDQKRAIQAVTIHPELSIRAQTLLARIERGHWYKPHTDKVPKAMQELIDHGLVRVAMRVESVAAAYVSLDHTPGLMDRAPNEG